MSRVNSARIAAIKAEHAGLVVEGAVMASDAFFPFRDGIDNAAKAGIKCIIQPVVLCVTKKPLLQMKQVLQWSSRACTSLPSLIYIHIQNPPLKGTCHN